MPQTTFTLNKVAEAIVGKTTFTAPVNYVGLSTTTPVIAGTGATEPVGNAYARVTTSAATWATAAAGVTSNATAVTFPTATGTWGTVTYVVVFDAVTAGNLLWFAPLGVSKTVGSGDTPAFAIGQVTETQV
jgi:hypothetical protein